MVRKFKMMYFGKCYDVPKGEKCAFDILDIKTIKQNERDNNNYTKSQMQMIEELDVLDELYIDCEHTIQRIQ